MYSQGEEEKYILAACPSDAGRFLDIGAWSSETFSNTRALYNKGWDGVMIEPSPGPMSGLLSCFGEEPRVTLIQAAMGLQPGLMDMHITDDAVSTADPDVYLKWKETAKYRGSILVPAITWEQIMNQFGGFEFVSIDAEGLSVDLFHRMLALGILPPCVCVEHDDRMGELCSAATSAGYAMTFSNATNCVFVRGK